MVGDLGQGFSLEERSGSEVAELKAGTKAPFHLVALPLQYFACPIHMMFDTDFQHPLT